MKWFCRLLCETTGGHPYHKPLCVWTTAVEIVTDDLGLALMEVTVPNEEDILAFSLTFDGDDRHMPLTYSIGVPPPTPPGFNWLLWVGSASVVVAFAITAYAGRKVRHVPLPAVLRRRRVTAAPATEVASAPGAEDLTQEELIELQATGYFGSGPHQGSSRSARRLGRG